MESKTKTTLITIGNKKVICKKLITIGKSFISYAN